MPLDPAPHVSPGRLIVLAIRLDPSECTAVMLHCAELVFDANAVDSIHDHLHVLVVAPNLCFQLGYLVELWLAIFDDLELVQLPFLLALWNRLSLSVFVRVLIFLL